MSVGGVENRGETGVFPRYPRYPSAPAPEAPLEEEGASYGACGHDTDSEETDAGTLMGARI